MSYSKPLTNAEVIQNYADLVSTETQTKIKSAITTQEADFEKYPLDVMNDFINELTNKLFEQRIYDPLKFKQIYEVFIERSPMGAGSIVEHLGLDVPESRPYTGDSTLGTVRNKPKVYVTRTHVQDKDTIEISYNNEIIKQAFLQEGGLHALISNILMKIEKRVNIDLYKRITADLEKQITKTHKMTSRGQDDATAKDFMRELIEFTERLRFPSKLYNEVGNTANLDNGVLILNVNTKANIDVNFYVTAFNSNREELSKYFSDVIIVDNIADPNTIGFIMDKEAYYCKFVVDYAKPFEDPSNMTTTFYKHVVINRGLTGQCVAVKLTADPLAA